VKVQADQLTHSEAAKNIFGVSLTKIASGSDES